MDTRTTSKCKYIFFSSNLSSSSLISKILNVVFIENTFIKWRTIKWSVSCLNIWIFVLIFWAAPKAPSDLGRSVDKLHSWLQKFLWLSSVYHRDLTTINLILTSLITKNLKHLSTVLLIQCFSHTLPGCEVGYKWTGYYIQGSIILTLIIGAIYIHSKNGPDLLSVIKILSFRIII